MYRLDTSQRYVRVGILASLGDGEKRAARRVPPGPHEVAAGRGPPRVRQHLTHVTCARVKDLRRCTGRVRAAPVLADGAREYGESGVYVVEVCQGCAWNHLTVSYVLGHGDEPRSQRG
ncbi:DUF5318 family protein [Actinomadura sp. 21ATH]|uniref:DUF5318 family protein n=1 Tax=Actinomadura sp. 21ATH TaxID=1735444 RepID=UPI0035C1104B